MAEALVITDTTYAGEAASAFITRPVINADTVQKGAAHVQDGIKKQYTIPRVDVANFIQRRAATPISQGTVTVDGKVLIPQDLMLYLEFNPRDYEQHWYATQLNPKLLDRELPPTAEEFTVMQTMKRLNEYFENHIWRGRLQYDPLGAAVNPTSKNADAGDSAYFYFDGLIKKMLDASDIITVSSPLVLIAGATAGGNENINDALMRCYKKVPKALLYKYGPTGLKIHVSYATQQVYEDYITTSTVYKNNDTTERGINKWKGYDIVPLAGMPDNTIVFAVSSPGMDSNLWIGMNSTDDENSLQLARLQANSELFFLKGLYKMDTQIGFPDFVVLYTSITA